MSFFSRMFTPSSNSKYLFNTLESLSRDKVDSGHIVLYFDKINPNIWEGSSYNDSNAIDILGKDNFRALMFGIRYSNKPAEKRLQMWEEKEEEKQTIKKINSAPSTRYMATPGSIAKDRELEERLRRLKEGGRRKSKSKKISKSIRSKSIRSKSMKKKGKSIRRKSVKMY